MEYTKSYRQVKELQWAKKCDPPAMFKKPPKCKGARAKGYTYERTVGRRIKARINAGEINGELICNQWFQFEDANGVGLCQTDYFLICPGFIVLIECKLSQSTYAEDQMTKLYEPILRKVYGLPVICLQVFKNVRGHPHNSVLDIMDLIKYPRTGVFTWHYLG